MGHYHYEDNVFTQILDGKKDALIIKENDLALAFLDQYPVNPGHTLVVPKKHFVNWEDCDDASIAAVSIMAKEIATLLRTTFPEIKGFNYVSNQNKIAEQAVFHFHLHIIPKYTKAYGWSSSVKKVNQLTLEEVYAKLCPK